jgi:superfamily II DNA or RNA helicase
MIAWDKIMASTSTTMLTKKQPTLDKKRKRKDAKGLEVTVYTYGVRVSMYDLKDRGLYKTFTNKFTLRVPVLTYTKKVLGYQIPNLALMLPRFGGLEYLKSYRNVKYTYKLKKLPPPKNTFKWRGAFRNNQTIIAKKILNGRFSNARARQLQAGAIVNLEAGQGKSYLAAGLIEPFCTKTLVVCHNTTIMRQWVNLLKQAYPENSVGIYYGKHHDAGCDITVGIINSLLMDEMVVDKSDKKKVTPGVFFNQFGFVIIDEVHLFSSKGRSDIYSRLRARYVLGLSATPDENAPMDTINTWGCGSIIRAEDLPGYTVKEIPFKGKVTRVAYTSPTEYSAIILNETTDMISHSKMINQMCDDPYRVHLIVKLIFELKSMNKFIFVFADRRSYLATIKEHMQIFNIASVDLLNSDDESHVMQLMGGASDEDLDNARANATIILTTYQYMGTGASIPKMDAIVLATPRKRKSKQYAGRIFRLGSNYESEREIFDIVDTATYMKGQYNIRKKYYVEKGFPITCRSFHWSSIKDEMRSMGLAHADDAEEAKDKLSTTLAQLEALLGKRA